MTRVVVHIGAQRTASAAIHRSLLANAELLRASGVLVPAAGRYDASPLAIHHNHLPWDLDPDGDHPHEPGVWDALSAEVASTDCHTVFLSSDVFATIAADPDRAPLLRDRLTALSGDVTLAFLAREQLGLLNDLYAQRVKVLEVTAGFDTYLVESPDASRYDLTSSFGRWYDDGDVRFVASPWDADSDEDPFLALLRLCDLPVPPDQVVRPEAVAEIELGPVGIEAVRLLGAYLRGRFPDFRPGEPAARRLRRKVALTAQNNAWCDIPFWGWSPAQTVAAEERYSGPNQEFARRLWGGDWPLQRPPEDERQVADLWGLGAQATNRVHRFVNEMERSFARLRSSEVAAS